MRVEAKRAKSAGQSSKPFLSAIFAIGLTHRRGELIEQPSRWSPDPASLRVHFLRVRVL
jgi:hypothetical protein